MNDPNRFGAGTLTSPFLGNALRLIHTVRYLKVRQVIARLRRHAVRPAITNHAAPALRPTLGHWAFAAPRDQTLVAANAARFLGRTRLIDQSVWVDGAEDKLWLYNLHYFDDLNALGSKERSAWHRALIGRWLAELPPGVGVGWDAYPVSLRVVNWIKWSLAGEVLDDAWVQSLAVQTRWLARRLEYHLLGNHLLANAKALVFAGAFFAGAEGERWRRHGLRLLERELDEQMLADGGHFERSPMYHSIILEDLLDLINLARAYPELAPDRDVERWIARAARMRSWLSAMTHPDGGIAFFNDAALGIAADPAATDAYATRLGLPTVERERRGVRLLPESGYATVRMGEGTTILDVAPVGADYQPGHAHADTLSFELSVGSERVIVNGGTSEYGDTPQRHYERSTAAHSTVEVDGQDSSEVWSSFRVARRARPFDLKIDEAAGTVRIECAHDGYRRLRGKPVHRRIWAMTGGGVAVSDRVEGAYRSAIARFHLGPGVRAEASSGSAGGSVILLRTPNGRAIRLETSRPAEVEVSEWHPEFGATIATSCVSVAIRDSVIETRISW